MKLTAKGRYAIMAMTDLAAQGPNKVVSLSEIASRQSISLAFLEQLFGKLRKAGLVDSHRGQSGGYSLSRPSSSIALDKIIDAVDEDIKLHGCTPEIKQNCTGHKTQCLTHSLWDALEAHIEDFLAKVSVADVVEQNIAIPPSFEEAAQ
ncbi:MAG: Rrf2 family transcriptional regulator [Hellea sp.]|nr:Rrf2 family transcriptional regulator [Hellea sp.]